MTLVIFHKQSNGRRTPVESKSIRSCNQRISCSCFTAEYHVYRRWLPDPMKLQAVINISCQC